MLRLRLGWPDFGGLHETLINRNQSRKESERWERIIVGSVLMIAMVAIALSQETTKMADHGLFTPTDIKWMDAPNALPAGAKLAMLEGNPFQSWPLYDATLDACRLQDSTALAWEG